MQKKSLPLSRVYRLLEPGPVLLLTTAHAGRSNVMTLSWHSMLEFEPPLVGCVVSERNHSFGLLQSSGRCVLNIPTEDLARAVVGCGNTCGAEVDKFTRFGLTRRAAQTTDAPLIDECFASLEGRVVDTGLVRSYSMFVIEIVKAWADLRQADPPTLHHGGYGSFRVAGRTIKLRSKMR